MRVAYDSPSCFLLRLANCRSKTEDRPQTDAIALFFPFQALQMDRGVRCMYHSADQLVFVICSVSPVQSVLKRTSNHLMHITRFIPPGDTPNQTPEIQSRKTNNQLINWINKPQPSHEPNGPTEVLQEPNPPPASQGKARQRNMAPNKRKPETKQGSRQLPTG